MVSFGDLSRNEQLSPLLEMSDFNLASFRQYAIRGGTALGVGRLIAAGCAFALTLLIARFLPLDSAGIYFLWLSAANLLSQICVLGSPTLVDREMAIAFSDDSQAVQKTVLASGWLLLAIGSLVCFLLFLGLRQTGLLPKGFDAPFSLLVVLWAVLLGVQQMLGELQRARRSFAVAVVFGGSLFGVLSIVFLFLAIWWTPNLTLPLVVLATIGALAVNALAGTIVLVIQLAERMAPVLRDTTTTILRRVPAFFPQSLAALVLAQADIWFLAFFVSAADLAMFGVAARIAVFGFFSMVVLQQLIFPVVAVAISEGDTTRVEQMIKSMFMLVVVPTLVVYGIVLSFREELIVWLYGENYARAAAVLLILLTGQALVMLLGPSEAVLASARKGWEMLIVTSASVLLALSVGFLLVNHYGITGVALAFSIARVLQRACYTWLCRSRLNIRTTPLIW